MRGLLLIVAAALAVSASPAAAGDKRTKVRETPYSNAAMARKREIREAVREALRDAREERRKERAYRPRRDRDSDDEDCECDE